MARLSESEIRTHLEGLPSWERVNADGAPCIRKVFKTGSFLNGLGFTTRVAVLAETMNHHPDVELTYPGVTLKLTTHDAGGLTDKDFELARRIDELGAP